MRDGISARLCQGCLSLPKADPALVGYPPSESAESALARGKVARPAGLGQRMAPANRRTAVWMFLVTGGAGFIGSNVVASLNEAGRSDVVVNDVLGTDGKWRNLQQAPARRRGAAGRPVRAGSTGRKLDAVIHMGAISDTTATDGDLVMENNFRLSLRLLDWCTDDAHAVHLRLVGRDLRRRRRRASTTTGRRRRCSGSSR